MWVGAEQSKQSNYYYRHKAERLIYQANYYQKNKAWIKQYQSVQYTTKKVEREEHFAKLFRNQPNLFSFMKQYVRQKVKDPQIRENSLYHVHGAPSTKPRTYNKFMASKGEVEFHVVPELSFVFDCFGNPEKVYVNSHFKLKDEITSRQLSKQLANFLGLNYGESVVFKHDCGWKWCLNFDGSGLDIGSLNGLKQLVACRIETGLTGHDLLTYYAVHYSKGAYVQYYRGTKILMTSELTSAYKSAKALGYV